MESRKREMKFNDREFVRVSMGPNQDMKIIPLFTPDYSYVIDQQESVRDIGVIIEDYCKKEYILSFHMS